MRYGDTNVGHRLNRTPVLFAALSALLSWGPVQALPESEDAKAEALLKRIASAQDHQFIRNGTTYDAQTAAEFVRRKCAGKREKLNTAQEFIAACASASSTSSKPYSIKDATGRERPSAQVLGEWLAEIEHK